MSAGYVVSFISSHSKGGQHTNGPDYGKIVVEHEAFGIRIEMQTRSGFPPHKARELAISLIEIAAGEMP